MQLITTGDLCEYSHEPSPGASDLHPVTPAPQQHTGIIRTGRKPSLNANYIPTLANYSQ